MRSQFRSVLALVLCAVLVFSCAPVTLQAETTQGLALAQEVVAPAGELSEEEAQALKEEMIAAGKIAKESAKAMPSPEDQLKAWAKENLEEQPDSSVPQEIPDEVEEEAQLKVKINPVYEYLFEENGLKDKTAELVESAPKQANAELLNETYHPYLSDALEDAANQLVNRNEWCYIRFQDYGEFYGEYMYNRSEASLEALTEMLIDMTMEHNGDPVMGDYLKNNYYYYGYYFIECGINSKTGMHEYTLMFYIDFFTTASQESYLARQIDTLLNRLNVYNASDYEKVKAVYDWICANVRYDDAGAEAGIDDLFCHSAYAALIEKEAVCQGYALLMYRMLLELGVDNRIITGSNHAWNIVELNYQYYNCDTTWDEGVPPEDYLFFLGGEDAFDWCGGHDREYEYDTASFHSAYPMAWAAYTPGQEKIELEATGLSLSVKDVVKYNLYFDVENVPQEAEIYTIGMFVYNSDPYTAASFDPMETVGAARYTGKGNGYVLQTTGGAAKEMGDMLWFEPYVMLSDGSMYFADVVEKSVKTYAEEVLAGNYDAEMKSLAVAMLNYGAAAQTWFGYNMGAMANRSLTAAQQALVKEFSTDMLVEDKIPDASKTKEFPHTPGGVGMFGNSTSLGSAININYYFEPEHTPDADSVKLYFWDDDTFWDLNKLTKKNADLVVTMTDNDRNGEWYAQSPALTAKEIDDTMYVSVMYTSGGKTYCTGIVPHSVNSYCASVIENPYYHHEFVALAKAMVVYGYYADAYFD